MAERPPEIIRAGDALTPTNNPPPDLASMLLADKRSAATRRAYAGDLRAFFDAEPTPGLVGAFVALPARGIAERLALFKARMLGDGLSEATINRRLSAVRALLKLAHRLGVCSTDGRGLVDGEKSRTYRDTRGVDLETLRALLALPNRGTKSGLRDAAILQLLAENALRRAEVAGLEVAHAELEGKPPRLWILGKGRGSQREPITLSPVCARAIRAYLAASGHSDGSLFRAHARNAEYQAFSGSAVYDLVRRYGAKLGIPNLAPHKLRHSAITAALDATGGDLRRVQRLSRHADVRTLQRYDDSREDFQGEVTGLLSAALHGGKKKR
jgi:integrase/recombinase XerC